MENPDQVFNSFCEAYAEAVLILLRTNYPAGLFYSTENERYTADEMGDLSATDAEFCIGDDWQKFTGRIFCSTKPSNSDYSEERLSTAVSKTLMGSNKARDYCLAVAKSVEHDYLVGDS